uniref:uncharacterized protein LOC129133886 isoform X1 n=1 Tax=Agelaius phoeniceus TaxID=39638 RepID=UPI0023EAF5C9|nr:uncharacterized protein LOC129133886 isoform X1 [Agelaius phoeniceus]XP_054509515.1 uncharacterized protein LOC129133886 isoform X1 [Agelaius phoeniceus]XP_054509516.1 uncharacterized protein LOC129133886 isoform X1 [Agelaius phoeniceus]XP_054509518.1 uncharacterized protein LOC129133886 isoform X1 [Agelaius phoeniceus]XP_054509519.1 uncharacterized protein LOC129133886 isoform X1 [Agelaius phoeniceus]XP_054509520.1 uncharacterized protein LOC129133886 isoform X1 [Agelaius phoeniceus]XP_05
MAFAPLLVQPAATVVVPPAMTTLPVGPSLAAPSMAGSLAMAQPVAGPPASGLVPSPSVSQPMVGLSNLGLSVGLPPPVTRWLSSPSLDEDLDSNDSQQPVPWQECVPVVDCRHQQVESSSTYNLWTSPPCRVTVRPRNPCSFWDEVKTQASEAGGRGLLDRAGRPRCTAGDTTLALGGGATGVDWMACPASEGGAWVVQKDHVLPQGKVSTLSMFKAVPNLGLVNRHDEFAWRAIQDLWDQVAKYGLGSAQFMQALRALSTDLLPPFDIKHIGQVLFQPVQYVIFKKYWTQTAVKVVGSNRLLPQADPRYGMGVDALLGEHAFSNPDFQATWDTAVLELCQNAGFGALVKTIEAASPAPQCTTIVQGPGEPFMPFVEKVVAALEKQVEDIALRESFCKMLVWFNVNSDCWKIIDALPGTRWWQTWSMHVLRRVLWTTECLLWKLLHSQARCPQGADNGKGIKIRARKSKVCPSQQVYGTFLCSGCLKAGHCSDQCRAKFHANGQPLVGPGNGKKSAQRNCTLTQVIPPGHDAGSGLPRQLRGITRGSAGVDVHTTSTVILESCCEHKVPLDVLGPLGQGLGVLHVGRSSVTHQGIFVSPESH